VLVDRGVPVPAPGQWCTLDSDCSREETDGVGQDLQHLGDALFTFPPGGPCFAVGHGLPSEQALVTSRQIPCVAWVNTRLMFVTVVISSQQNGPSRGGIRAVPNARSVAGASRAASVAVDKSVTNIRLPLIGEIRLPPPQHLVWYAGVAVLTVAEVVEWPLAILLVIGKALADNRSSEALREFGEALEQAG
jgi:hypothetical protein